MSSKHRGYWNFNYRSDFNVENAYECMTDRLAMHQGRFDHAICFNDNLLQIQCGQQKLTITLISTSLLII